MNYKTIIGQLGLSSKEAAIYMAGLELGPSPVQDIARKAQIARPTAYLVLDSLIRKGLVTRHKNHKTLFSMESPRNLLRFIEQEEERIHERREELEKVLPELQAIMKDGDRKPTVRYFDGIEGLRSMRWEMVMRSKSGDVWYSLNPADHLFAAYGENEQVWSRHRIAKGIHSKIIFTTQSPRLRDSLIKNSRIHHAERRFISPERYPSTSGFTVFGDCIAIGSFAGELCGVVIEGKSMADMMRHAFLIMWDSLPPSS